MLLSKESSADQAPVLHPGNPCCKKIHVDFKPVSVGQ